MKPGKSSKKNSFSPTHFECSTCNMAPKKRPVPKAVAASKVKRVDIPGSPSDASVNLSGKYSTPLVERIMMAGNAGNTLDLNISSQSIARESVSPFPKKVRSTSESGSVDENFAPRLSVEHENSISKVSDSNSSICK